ncbi:MAG: primosomal protein N', partial [Muribaculaceae bacterium]|nr:primosomal protein N' [Muribaculaceae bacterium]
VAGRAGRRADTKGKVIIQTTQPEHPVIGFTRSGDYDGFYEYELNERQTYAYPPFTRIVNIYLKHKNKSDALVAASMMANQLRSFFGNRVLGPDEPPVGRVQSLYIQRIMLKMETNVSMPKVKRLLTSVHHSLLDDIRFPKSLIIYYDVDPM